MTFTVTDLVAQFDPATYARGEAYASKGKVKRVQYANGRLEGEVEGSGGATYQQRIRIHADGGRSTIDGRCACPVARNCKHVVATLLFSLKQEQAALAGGVPAHAEQWMTQLSGAVQLAARQTPLGPLFQPLYVLIPDPDEGRLHLHLRRARLRKDGSLYGAVSGISPFELLASPERVTADQEECLRLYAALRSGAYHTTGATPPAGRTGARLLALACAQGCLHYAARDTQLKTEALHAITMGPARAASLGWYADPHGAALRLGWRFADGSPVQHVLPTDPPRYLSDGKLGDIDLGKIAPSLPLTGLLQLIAQAPPVAPTQGATVARRMLEQGLDALLPLPQAVRTRRRDDIPPLPHLLLDSQLGPAPPVGRGREPAGLERLRPALLRLRRCPHRARRPVRAAAGGGRYSGIDRTRSARGTGRGQADERDGVHAAGGRQPARRAARLHAVARVRGLGSLHQPRRPPARRHRLAR